MSIESLKQQARRHEQNEEWRKALDHYQKAIKELTRDDQTDIGLINRVGDLFVRVGSFDEAVDHYEQAVDLYREAFLPNNAIAVCKKIIRNVPNRHRAYLKIGQIRAEQGFLPDARTNFLTYAERMQQAGDMDESFRALVEFCDLAPDDVEVRITVADQMVASERTSEGVEQLIVAYTHLTQSGERDLAAGVERKILALDPSADLGAALEMAEIALGAGDGGIESQFGDIEFGAGLTTEPFGREPKSDAPSKTDLEIGRVFGAGEPETEPSTAAPEDAEEEEEFATMGFDDDDSEEKAVELPIMAFDDDDSDEEAVELPIMAFDDDDSDEEVVELPIIGFDDSDADEPVELPTIALDGPPEALEEAHEESAHVLFEAPPLPEPTVAADVPVEPPEAEPVSSAPAAKEDYIDLGAMVLGGGDPKSTRFKVAYEEPTGDEDADFAKMLSQFKDKVSENLDTGDVRAHYDLGTAYKEMGLLEEAISSFQAALRASSDHLPTYEIMGQTFLELGRPEAAVKALQRALEIKGGVEDEFVGIYYYLARAFEALDRKDAAVEYYDRVFSLDINFADVTERLRELR